MFGQVKSKRCSRRKVSTKFNHVCNFDACNSEVTTDVNENNNPDANENDNADIAPDVSINENEDSGYHPEVSIDENDNSVPFPVENDDVTIPPGYFDENHFNSDLNFNPDFDWNWPWNGVGSLNMNFKTTLGMIIGLWSATKLMFD